MSNTKKFEKSRLDCGRSAIKNNKLLLNNFYTLKVFDRKSCTPALARSGEANSETFIDVVKMTLPMAVASRKNAGKFSIEAGGR